MPRVAFTPNLKRHLEAPEAEAAGESVGEVLARVFEDHPRLRSYVLDEQGRLRRHVTVFVNGEMIRDRLRLTDPVRPDDEIFVMQALSGG